MLKISEIYSTRDYTDQNNLIKLKMIPFFMFILIVAPSTCFPPYWGIILNKKKICSFSDRE